MSDIIKASQLQICIFVLSAKEYEDQTPQAKGIFDSFANVVIDIQQRHNSMAPIELDFCPMSLDVNAVIIAKHHLDISRLPAVQVMALYPDGSKRSYFLKTGLGGIDFTSDVVRPYVEALLYNRISEQKPIICKILPPACSIGAWLWLALAGYAAYRTTQARNVGKVAWGGVAMLAGEAFVKGGGIEQIKSMVK